MKPTVTVAINSSAVIECNITLNTAFGHNVSALNYSWSYDNIDITNRSELLEQNNNAVTTILNITSIQLSNTGDYQCSAGIIGNNLMKSAFTKLCIKSINVFD